jgi:hypothetical protein
MNATVNILKPLSFLAAVSQLSITGQRTGARYCALVDCRGCAVCLAARTLASVESK